MCDLHYQTLESDSTAKSNIDTSICIPFTVEPNPFKLTKEQGESMRRNVTSMVLNVDTPFIEEPSIILCRPEYLDAAKKILDSTKKNSTDITKTPTIKHDFIPDRIYRVYSYTNSIPIREICTDLTAKPWGCVCGYCREENTVYLHSPYVTENYSEQR